MSNVYSIQSKKRTNCNHTNIIIDEALWQIECEDCKEIIDPIWFLSMVARKESNAKWNITELKKQEYELIKKQRCKCDHCGKITKISR